MASYLNHCRLCLQLIPDPVTAANIYTKLSDGVPLTEHLDTLFDVLVGDYSDGDDLKLLCSQCVAHITKCATGEASDAEAEAIGQRFQSLEGNARMFVRSQKMQNSSSSVLNASTNSAFGMTTPKAAAPRPVVSATTGKKRSATDEISMEWLLTQPSTSGTSRYTDRSQKKIVVREIHLDEDDDDHRETVVKTKCPFCKMTYVRHTALVKHIDTIHPEKEVKFKKCNDCGRSFLNAAELKAHKCPRKSTGRSWFWGRRSWW